MIFLYKNKVWQRHTLRSSDKEYNLLSTPYFVSHSYIEKHGNINNCFFDAFFPVAKRFFAEIDQFPFHFLLQIRRKFKGNGSFLQRKARAFFQFPHLIIRYFWIPSLKKIVVSQKIFFLHVHNSFLHSLSLYIIPLFKVLVKWNTYIKVTYFLGGYIISAITS